MTSCAGALVTALNEFDTITQRPAETPQGRPYRHPGASGRVGCVDLHLPRHRWFLDGLKVGFYRAKIGGMGYCSGGGARPLDFEVPGRESTRPNSRHLGMPVYGF